MSKNISDLFLDRFGLPGNFESKEVATETIALQLNHKTSRRFSNDPIESDVLKLIVGCGFSAPSKSDLQQSSLIQISDPDLRHEIGNLIPTMPWIIEAPAFFVICGDSRRIRRICKLKQKSFANDHLDAFLNAASDAAMVLQNMIVAAESVGLGSCPVSVIRNHMTKIVALLSLPKYVFPLAGLCIGRPLKPNYKSMRLPLSVTWHIDKYEDEDLPREVISYDQRRDEVFSIPREKQKFIQEYGMCDFYGWSEDKARQTSKPERADIGQIIRNQGFSLD